MDELLADANRWAFAVVAGFLSHRDIERLIVCALEWGGIELAHWLRFSAIECQPVNEELCLDAALEHTCWRAATLLLNGKRRTHAQLKAFPASLSHDRWFRCVQRVHRAVGYPVQPAALYKAAARGDFETVKWLHSRSKHVADTLLIHAASSRRLEIVQWLLDKRSGDDGVTCVLRLEHSPVGARAVCWQDTVFNYAITQSCGVVVRHSRAKENAIPLADSFALDGDIETLRMLQSHDFSFRWASKNAITNAASGGHLHVVQWLYNEVFREDLRDLRPAMRAAARAGRREVVGWLLQFPDTQDVALSEAVRRGRVELARWLWNERTYRAESMARILWHAALRSGDIDAVRLIHEECQLPHQPKWLDHLRSSSSLAHVQLVTSVFRTAKWDIKDFLDRVATDGSFDVLEYLIEVYNVWSPDAFKRSVERLGGLPIAQWIYKKGEERAGRLLTDVSTQIAFGDIDLLKLSRQGCASTAIWLLKNVPHVEFPQGPAAFRLLFRLVCEDVIIETSHTAYVSSTGELNSFIAACIKYRPTAAVLETNWLPQWAVIANDMDSFELLTTAEHSELYSFAMGDAIVEYSRNEAFMLQFLRHNSDYLQSFKATHWAAKYQRMLLLNFILEHCNNKCATLRSIAWTAARFGHVNLLNWTHAACESDLLHRVFRNLACSAARYGHVNVLQWLLRRELVGRDATQSIYRKALRFGHLECIKWADLVWGPADPILGTWAIRYALDRRDPETVAYFVRSARLDNLDLATHERANVSGLDL